jgi:acyl carrier protein
MRNKPPFHDSEVFEILERIITTQFENDTFALESILIKDFGADDLDIVEITMEIEDEFEISIPDKDLEKWKTVEDIFLYTCKKIGVEIHKIIHEPIENRWQILDIR